MPELRHIILLILCLSTMTGMAQRRYSVSEKREFELSSVRGFSTKDVENQTDVLMGLHASEYSGSHHLVGLSLSGGWSTFLNNMPEAKNTPGGGVMDLYLLYEYHFAGLMVQTGLGISAQRVFTDLNEANIYHENMMDTWSGITPAPFTLKHTFADRRDMAQQLYGRIPLNVGHYFFGSRGIGYFLVGVNAGYAFKGSTATSMIVSTAGKYERYVGIWEEMDNHGFRKDVPLERKGDQLALKFDLAAHAEIGYEYNTRQSVKNYRTRPADRLDGRLRVAAYADCSLLNICPSTKGVLYGIPTESIYDFSTYTTDHVFSTEEASKSWLRNLSIGIRVSFLFAFRPKDRCILCNPANH